MKKKESIREKRALSGYTRTDAGGFVTIKDSNHPIKMFVLQEMSKEQYLRIGYYVLSQYNQPRRYLPKITDDGLRRQDYS